VAVLCASAFLGCVAGASGQDLRLERDYPGTGPYECPAPATPAGPSDDERVRASQLTSDALQASILGDLEGARVLLEQASQADATSPDVAYRHARALEDLELREEAIDEYCRALALGAPDAGILDARQRLDTLYEIVRERITDVARGAFVSGLREADAGLFDQAAASFSVALEEVPDWRAAIYNRAIVRERLGRIQESLSDYRRYLLLTPSEVDPVVVAVSERIGMLEGAVVQPTPSPGAALALGVVPGMGHYYTGRSIGGTVVLALAGAAVASGFLVQDVTVRCLNTPPPGQSCPLGEVLDETSERPYLVPALGAAGAITLIGAIEAFVRARGRRAEQAAAVEELTSSFSVSGPSIRLRGGRVELSLLTVDLR
jgi:tetratricopeptide (TPR) repeat protein